MKVEQAQWAESKGWQPKSPGELANAQLVIVFGATELIMNQVQFSEIRSAYPDAQFVGCSTSGEIFDTSVRDNTITLTAIEFAHTSVKGVEIRLNEVNHDSRRAGETLAEKLDKDDLVHVIVISDGNNVNGSELVHGLTANLPKGVTATGGLAGDGDRFGDTYVFYDSEPETNKIAVVGLYGKRLKVGYGSMGGWDPFGPERLVTRSEGAVLYELDGQSALKLYKKYLGEYAERLPSSTLLFPLSLRTKSREPPGLVRTILNIDEEENAMIFAGDVPEGAYVRLMKANFERLVDGARTAAENSYQAIGSESPDLALLISCVGRKLVLKQHTEEEVKHVKQVLGESTTITGFYSYGEICPTAPNASCELHNQTMTITNLTEK